MDACAFEFSYRDKTQLWHGGHLKCIHSFVRLDCLYGERGRQKSLPHELCRAERCFVAAGIVSQLRSDDAFTLALHGP